MTTPIGFAREFLQITQESAFGTEVTSPTRGTNQIAIRLSGANQFTPRATPVTVSVPYGGGLNIEAETISDKTEVKGTLTTELCYSQSAFLLGWAMQQINSGQTTPWTTTEPPNQYTSCTIDHAIWQDDTGVYKRTRYPGQKVDGWKIEVSEESQKCMLSLDVVGSSYQGNTYDSSADPNATVFPQPLDTEYPTDFVLFIHSNGGLTLSGGTFAQYTNLSASGKNNQMSQFFASRFAQKIRSYGRKITLEANVNVLSTPDFRAAFQTLGAVTAEMVLTNGTHTLTFDFKTNARYEGLNDDLKLDQTFQRKLTLGSRYDRANNTDFAFTFA